MVQNYRMIVKAKGHNRLYGTVRVNWPPVSQKARLEFIEKLQEAFELIDPSSSFTLDASYYAVKKPTGRPMKKWN